MTKMDKATLTDSKGGAVRITDATDWRRFEMLRVVPESQDLSLTISLHGLGEVLVDDLQITTLTPPASVADEAAAGESPVKPARFLPLDRFDLRRLSPLPRRK